MPHKQLLRGRRLAISNMQNQIREAMDAGRTAQSRGKSEARFIELLNGKKLTLQNSGGQATEAGQAYYSLLGVPVPKLYNYEEPLINDQWVKGLSGRKILVRRRLADGSWRVTRQGEAYFQANRDEVVIKVPTLLVKQIASFSAGARVALEPIPDGVQLGAIANSKEYTELDQTFSVQYLLEANRATRYRRLATEAQRTNFVKQAANAYLNGLQPVVVVAAGGRVIRTVIIFVTSDAILIWGATRPLLESRRWTNIQDHGPPNTEVILNRPLRTFESIPDGLWRTGDLHPNAVKENPDVLCVVQMLRDSFARRKHVKADTFVYDYVMSTEDIECELDRIWDDLGYKS